MRFGFVTCVELGLSCMEAIYDVGGSLDVAITLQDDMARNKSGRVFLDDFCASRAIDLIKVRNINNTDGLAAIRDYELDWLFIIGWSQIARMDVLAAPSKGVIGMHPTLLPIGRGRAAIPWAILKGLDKTGVTMFQLDGGVDTGPIIAQHEIELCPATTATQLYEEVNQAHMLLMKRVFGKLCDDLVTPQAQDALDATEWPGRKPGDGQINLDGSVKDAERLVRAVTKPYPGAFADLSGRRIVVWSAEVCTNSAQVEDERPKLVFHDGVMIATEWDWTSPRD